MKKRKRNKKRNKKRKKRRRKRRRKKMIRWTEHGSYNELVDRIESKGNFNI